MLKAMRDDVVGRAGADDVAHGHLHAYLVREFTDNDPHTVAGRG